MNDRDTTQTARDAQDMQDENVAQDQRDPQQQTIREETRTTGAADRATDVRGTDARTTDVRDDSDASFLPSDRMDDLRERWDDIQTGFVDDPRTAVKNAQQLVGDLVTELTETFSRERGNLEGQWNSGGDADTEALRIALQRYRSFFNRLLNT